MKKKLFSVLLAAVLMATMLFGIIEVSAAPESPLDTLAPEDVVLSFTASNFRLPYADFGDAIVDDADSPYGKAATFSYDKRLGSGDSGLMNSMIRSGGQTLNMYIYNIDSKESIQLGAIAIKQMQANSGNGYAIYKFDDVAMMSSSGSYYIYMFDCWGFQQALNTEQVNALVGQTMDVYLSMKVTGNVSSTTPGDTPSYFIDKLVFAKSTSAIGGEHEHSYSEWDVSEDGSTHSSACLICGEKISGEHTWDDGEVTKEPSKTSYGEKKYTCTACGTKKYEELDKIRDEASTPTEGNQKPVTPNHQGGSNKNQDPASFNVGIIIAIVMFAAAAVITIISLTAFIRNSKQKEE